MADRVLADTSALLALVHRRDQDHGRAVAIGRRHLAAGGRYVSTALVMAELHVNMLRRRGPDEARHVVSSLLDDPAYEWIDASLDLVRAGLATWLERSADQPFSLTDAVSFEVMRRERLTHAFAFDDDFLTAGFQVLR